MEIISAEQYLQEDATGSLAELTTDHSAAWGKMTPQHMVEHLIITFKMSIGKINIPIITKEEDWPKTKAYLMKDSPMRRNVPSLLVIMTCCHYVFLIWSRPRLSCCKSEIPFFSL